MLRANSLALLQILYHLKVYPTTLDKQYFQIILKQLNDSAQQNLSQEQYEFLNLFLEKSNLHPCDIESQKLNLTGNPDHDQNTFYTICEKLGSSFKNTIIKHGLVGMLGAIDVNLRWVPNSIIELPLNFP
ncbi:MAG: hypothetical protein AAB657_00665 [Patescibacteria group bacterium]